jgi:DNA-binding HxlR family transcriptional regulator
MSTASLASKQAFQRHRGEVTSVAEILRLLSNGASGAILMALGEDRVRTKSLTERVGGYTPRTVYRHLSRLTELGLVEREERLNGGVAVVHSLSEGNGAELYDLVSRFTTAATMRMSSGQIEAHAWVSLGVLADLWEAGVVDAISRGPKSPTELARCLDGLSYHQLSRRTNLFNDSGYLCEREQRRPQRRCYDLTDKARQTMGLIVGIGRWRHRHLPPDSRPGLTSEEMATLLRAALPLARIPKHAGKGLELRIEGDGAAGRRSRSDVWAVVAEDGALRTSEAPPARVDGSAAGNVGGWVGALFEGERHLRPDDDDALVDDCLRDLFEILWMPASA